MQCWLQQYPFVQYTDNAFEMKIRGVHPSTRRQMLKNRNTLI